ncbi:hypothetical protein, partial [Xanthomonas euvesicatoria]
MRATTFMRFSVVLVGLAVLIDPAMAQDGSVLTEMENQVIQATRGWQDRVMQAATSLFWILAGIEVGIAAVMLAISAPALD